MASKETSRQLGKWAKIFRQFLLVVLMIGLEATVTLEVILMIANIQTLGVPIRFASVPGMVSAASGVFLIPAMGFLMDRRGKTKSAKAKILICTASLQLAGTFLVFLANVIKLMYYDDVINTYDLSSISPPTPNTTMGEYTVPSSLTSLEYLNESTTLSWTTVNFSEIESSKNIPSTQAAEEAIQYFAVFAMIGYALLDCGYDSSNCFLKTFALAATPSQDHSSIIIKSILVSSFGGCLISVVGSLGLGDYLTAGTGHDSNAAQCALVAALCFVLILSGLVTTLTTGFCCPPVGGGAEKDTKRISNASTLTVDDKSPLIGADASRDRSSSIPALCLSHSGGHHILQRTIEKTSGATPAIAEVIDHADLAPRRGFIGFLVRYKKQIIINVSTFFLLGALYSFEVFAVNFLGEGILKGDPQASVESEAYQRYLDGIQTGSLGTLTYYITFTVANFFHEFLLTKIGWKIEIIVATGVYCVINLVCALTATVWSYFLAAVWTGIFRTAAVTVPYILTNKIVREQGDGKDSGVAMAIVASMLPLGFTVNTALMGPLIDLTGNTGTPMYYTAVSAFLGLVTICFLRE